MSVDYPHPFCEGKMRVDSIQPAVIEALRKATQLRAIDAAQMIYAGERTWYQWEAGTRKMPPAAFELWCLACYCEGILPRGLIEPWVRPVFLEPARTPAPRLRRSA